MLLELKQFRQAPRYEPAGLTFVKNRIGCPKRAAHELGFTSEVDLRKGLLNLIAWRDRHKRDPRAQLGSI
jgi:UDP-glucose 4-epimerase